MNTLCKESSAGEAIGVRVNVDDVLALVHHCAMKYRVMDWPMSTQTKYTFAKGEFEMKEFLPQDVGIIKSSSLERLLIEAGSLPSKSLIFTYMGILVTTYRPSLVGTSCTQ